MQVNEEKRIKVFGELLLTEKSYTESLTKVVENYLKPLREKNIINGEDLHFLFSNIESILQANNILLKEFEKAGNDAVAISNVFLRLGEALKIYIEYVNNYEKSLLTLDKCIKIKAFCSFCNQIKKSDKTTVDLPSLLIMPIQRIPRYILLLREAIKLSKEESKEIESLKKALMKIEEIGVLINDKKKESDQLLRLIEIQHSLKGNPFKLIDPSRKFIDEGECEEDQNLLTYFFFNNLLLLTKNRSSKSSKKKYDYYQHFILNAEMSLTKVSPTKAKLEIKNEIITLNLFDEKSFTSFSNTFSQIKENINMFGNNYKPKPSITQPIQESGVELELEASKVKLIFEDEEEEERGEERQEDPVNEISKKNFQNELLITDLQHKIREYETQVSYYFTKNQELEQTLEKNKVHEETVYNKVKELTIESEKMEELLLNLKKENEELKIQLEEKDGLIGELKQKQTSPISLMKLSIPIVALLSFAVGYFLVRNHEKN